MPKEFENLKKRAIAQAKQKAKKGESRMKQVDVKNLIERARNQAIQKDKKGKSRIK